MRSSSPWCNVCVRSNGLVSLSGQHGLTLLSSRSQRPAKRGEARSPVPRPFGSAGNASSSSRSAVVDSKGPQVDAGHPGEMLVVLRSWAPHSAQRSSRIHNNFNPRPSRAFLASLGGPLRPPPPPLQTAKRRRGDLLRLRIGPSCAAAAAAAHRGGGTAQCCVGETDVPQALVADATAFEVSIVGHSDLLALGSTD